jgi:hypothetical protein
MKLNVGAVGSGNWNVIPLYTNWEAAVVVIPM